MNTKETTKKQETDNKELMLLLKDQAATYLEWSWEGTMGLEDHVESVGRKYSGKETTAVISAQTAIVQIEDQQEIVKNSIPDIPPLAALPKLKKWYHDVLDGGLSIKEARTQLNAIRNAPAEYSDFLRWLGVILLAIGFSTDVVGTWEGLYVAAITAIPAGICLLATGWIEGFNKIAGLVATFLSGVIAMVAWKFGYVNAAPGMLLISATFVFIPGDSISTQALEMASGRWGPSVDRLFYSIMILVLQVSGAVLAAIVTFTSMDELFPKGMPSDFAWWAIYPFSLVFLLGNVLAFQFRMKDYVPALLILLLARAGAQVGAMAYGDYIGTFVGMLLATLAAIWYDKKSMNHSPAYVFLLTPIFALSPGSHGLRALETWITGSEIVGVDNIDSLVGNLLAIAIGMLFGSMIMRGFNGKKHSAVKDE